MGKWNANGNWECEFDLCEMGLCEMGTIFFIFIIDNKIFLKTLLTIGSKLLYIENLLVNIWN